MEVVIGLALFYVTAMLGKFMLAIAWAVLAFALVGLLKLIEYVVFVLILKDDTPAEIYNMENN